MCVQKIEANKRGRDFVLGDLHGCYSEFQELLQQVDFNYSKDRVFCTGDLVDRGIQPTACLALLKEPWFYSVLGNHDLTFLLHIKQLKKHPAETKHFPFMAYDIDWEIFNTLHYHGGQWQLQFIQEGRVRELIQWEEILEELPLILSVEGSEPFHVVHAHLHQCDFEPFTIVPRTDGCIEKNNFSIYDKIEFISSRDLCKGNYPPEAEQLSAVFCGHTPTQPKVVMGHMHIDTGAGKGGFLSMLDLASKKLLSVQT